MPLNRIASEVAQLSAQHIGGETVIDDDGTMLFFIGDEENGVEITDEIGDPREAVRRLFQLADAIRAHAVRLELQIGGYQHGPHTGPGRSR